MHSQFSNFNPSGVTKRDFKTTKQISPMENVMWPSFFCIRFNQIKHNLGTIIKRERKTVN